MAHQKKVKLKISLKDYNDICSTLSGIINEQQTVTSKRAQELLNIISPIRGAKLTKIKVEIENVGQNKKGKSNG